MMHRGSAPVRFAFSGNKSKIAIAKATSDRFMNAHLALGISSFCVANLRDSWPFSAICVLNLKILEHDLLRPE